MFWTLELASSLDDAPWPATKEELIDYATRTCAPDEVIENLEELDDDKLKTWKNWTTTMQKSTNPSKTSGRTIPPKRTSCGTRRSINLIIK